MVAACRGRSHTYRAELHGVVNVHQGEDDKDFLHVLLQLIFLHVQVELPDLVP